MNAALSLALAWGFGEATFFFLVPDVWLSFLALQGFGEAFAGSLTALAGALTGGLLMWVWGRMDPDGARKFLVRIPAIQSKLLDAVGVQLQVHGFGSVLIGPLRGIPYKIYAVEAGAANRSLAQFLLVSIPARYLRFIGAVGAFWLAGRILPFSLAGQRIAVAIFWCVFYALYFRRMTRALRSE